MSDTHLPPSDALAARFASRRRFAYTLNNAQPVRCTYISEEPLFYLDDMASIEEEAEFDFTSDLFADFSDFPPASVTENTDEAALNLFAEQLSNTGETVPLSQTLTDLRTSRMGAALLDFALENNAQIDFADQLEPASYDRDTGRITLRAGLSSHEQTLLLVRELRRLWQHRQGTLIHPLLFHPDQAIVVNRVLSADLMTLMVRVAWELRLAGQPAAWDMLETRGHHDLTRAFAREALADFRALASGRANTAVFEAWFISERCRTPDRKLIQQMLADYQGYIAKAGHAETSKVLTQQIISALGEMPYGKNYLSPHAATILADALFTEIRDRSSANFLWFIKFEQSFRLSERDLQVSGGEPTLSASPRTHGPSSNTAQVIPYPAATAGGRDGAARRAAQGVVVDLQFWRTRDRHSD